MHQTPRLLICPDQKNILPSASHTHTHTSLLSCSTLVCLGSWKRRERSKEGRREKGEGKKSRKEKKRNTVSMQGTPSTQAE